MLDLQEARARSGLELRVRDATERLERAFDVRRAVRKRPWVAMGIAAATGFLAGPALFKVVSSPRQMLRVVGSTLAPMGRIARSAGVGAFAVALRSATRFL